MKAREVRVRRIVAYHEAGHAEGYEAGQKAERDEAMAPPGPPPSTEA